MGFARRFAPGVPDAVFGIVLTTVLVGGHTGFLNDPGTFWHLRLGREILQTGDVPRYDTLTFSREQQPWVDQSWLFDVGLASLVNRFGWPAAVAAAALIIAALYGTLARGLIGQGTSPVIALAVSLIAVGIASIHFLVRPHLFTFVFVLWFLEACRRQHEQGGWHVAALPPLTVIWANLHGGFLAGPVIVLTALLGHVVSGPWDETRRRNTVRFGAALALCVVAPLANPYGFGLYRHVGNLLVSSGVTDLIDEFQPMPFGQAKARVFEWVVLGLIALPVLGLRRLSRYDLAHTLVWLHFALGSIRHAPLFALAMAPGLAHLLDGLPLTIKAARWRGEWTAWSPAIGIALLALSLSGVPVGAFSPTRWPLQAVPVLNGRPAEARLFHEQDWGGLIEAETAPLRRAFVDDRFELFGRAAIVEYLEALQGGPQWDAIQQRERFDLVWVRPERGVAKRLESDPAWRIAYRDAVSVLFERVVPPATAAAR